jgi:hypothetical protein
VAAICESFGYEAFIVQRGEKIAALPAISALGEYELGKRNRVAQCPILTAMRVAHRFASTAYMGRSGHAARVGSVSV